MSANKTADTKGRSTTKQPITSNKRIAIPAICSRRFSLFMMHWPKELSVNQVGHAEPGACTRSGPVRHEEIQAHNLFASVPPPAASVAGALVLPGRFELAVWPFAVAALVPAFVALESGRRSRRRRPSLRQHLRRLLRQRGQWRYRQLPPDLRRRRSRLSRPSRL